MLGCGLLSFSSRSVFCDLQIKEWTLFIFISVNLFLAELRILSRTGSGSINFVFAPCFARVSAHSFHFFCLKYFGQATYADGVGIVWDLIQISHYGAIVSFGVIGKPTDICAYSSDPTLLFSEWLPYRVSCIWECLAKCLRKLPAPVFFYTFQQVGRSPLAQACDKLDVASYWYVTHVNSIYT